MQESTNGDGEDAEDEAPSDTFIPSVPLGGPSEEDEIKRLITRLLELSAITLRGQIANADQVAAVEDTVAKLEELNPNPSPVETELIDGTWLLVYTGVKLYRTSPFLLASATPLLQVGQVRQTLSVDSGKLTTEVDVTSYPVPTTGTIKTTCRLTPVGGERLEFTAEKTTVTGGKIADRIDLGGINFDIPVEQIYSRIKNTSPDSYVDTYFLNEKLRISRAKSGKLYIYTRAD